MQLQTPEKLLFIQHGWKDISKSFTKLAQGVATPEMLVVNPNLGYLNTWFKIERLISILEAEVLEIVAQYPDLPLRIIAHSLGGCVWLELLEIHPELLPKIENLILLGSPIAGADMARIIDPFGMLPTIARALGKNRRPLGEKIAKIVPTLVIVGDKDHGSDGTIVEGSTLIKNAQFKRLIGLNHKDLRNHDLVIETINQYWQGTLTLTEINPLVVDQRDEIIAILEGVNGMTCAHFRDFKYAQTYLKLKNGLQLKLWKNPVQVAHVFLADQYDHCLYAGFVGWLHSQELNIALTEIKQLFSEN